MVLPGLALSIGFGHGPARVRGALFRLPDLRGLRIRHPALGACQRLAEFGFGSPLLCERLGTNLHAQGCKNDGEGHKTPPLASMFDRPGAGTAVSAIFLTLQGGSRQPTTSNPRLWICNLSLRF